MNQEILGASRKSSGGIGGAIVLFSGGLDSTVNLWQAKEEFSNILAISFDYGQKAAKKEIFAAKAFCKELNVDHKIIDLPWFKQFTSTSLVNSEESVPQSNDVKIADQESSEKTAKMVWVPNRNGIFLNIAAGFAEGLGFDIIIPGFNAEEAATFPDNSVEFCQAVGQSLKFSTANGVKVKSYTLSLDKTGIVKKALELNVPLEKTWPCYLDQKTWCGQCESCLRFSRALNALEVDCSKLNF